MDKLELMVREGKLTEEEAAYFRKAYPEGYGDDLVKVANETADKRSARLQRENTVLRQERSALLRSDRAMDVARKSQAAGLIPSARDFEAEGQSPADARTASAAERTAETKRLLELDDRGFDLVSRHVEAAWKREQTNWSKPLTEEPASHGTLVTALSDQRTEDEDPAAIGGASQLRLASAFTAAVDTAVVDQAMKDGPTYHRGGGRRR